METAPRSELPVEERRRYVSVKQATLGLLDSSCEIPPEAISYCTSDEAQFDTIQKHQSFFHLETTVICAVDLREYIFWGTSMYQSLTAKPR